MDDFMDNLNRLEELAKKATKENWNCVYRFDEWENYVGPEEWADMGQSVCICRYGKDAAYIAEANPAFILELISKLKAINEQCGQVFKEACEYKDKLDELEKVKEYPKPNGDEKYNEFVAVVFKNNLALLKNCNLLFEERDRLKAQIKELKEICDTALSRAYQFDKEADWQNKGE